MKSYFYILFILILPLLLISQRSTQRMYTMDDGLYSSTVNGVWMTYDSLFYVWDGSRSNGITKFDGYHFENIHVEGLSPYLLSDMKNLSDHSLICNYDDGYYLYQNEEFEKILDFKSKKESLLGYWTNDDALFKATLRKEVFKYKRGSNKWIFDHEISDVFHRQLDSLHAIGHRVSYSESVDGEKVFMKNTEFELVEGSVKIFDLESSLYKHYTSIPKANVFDLNKEIWQQLFYYRDSYDRVNYIANDSTYCHVLKEGDGSFYLIEYDAEGEIVDHGEVKGSNMKAMKLNGQAYYISSHDGLQKINPRIKYFPSTDPEMIGGLYSIIESNDGSVWMGGYGTGLTRYNGDHLEKVEGKYASAFVMPGARRLENGISLFFQDNLQHGLYKLDGDHIELLNFEGQVTDMQHGYIVKELSDHTIALGNMKSTVSIISDLNDSAAIEYISREDSLKVKNVLCIEEDLKGRLWLGHPATGVDLYDRKNKQAYNYEITSEDAKSFGAISMVIDGDDRLWMGSKQGLKMLEEVSSFDPMKQNLFVEAKSVPLPNGDFSTPNFLIEVDNYIVCGTKKAVSFIDKNSLATKPANPIIYQLIYGEDIEGNGSQQNCVLFDSQRRLWIGSNEGASMMLWDEYEWDQTINKIDIKSIMVGSQSIQLSDDDQFELPVDNRNAKITFGLKTNVSLLKNVFFDYFLINEDQDTIQHVVYDQDGELDLAYVRAGEYELHINARKHGQLMDTRKIHINAPLSLSENPIFWGGLIAFLFTLMAVFFWWRSKQNKILFNKQLELSKMQTVQQSLSVQAIVSSFNPHFINNSLHWVQSKYRKDQEMATVVGRLSENTRYIFEKTKQGEATHTIASELDVVDNYVQIQMVRFKDTFEYRAPAKKIIDRLGHHTIFLMMLQIHVENAIEHGLRNRKESSYVSLDISDDEHNIIIKIEDDGIGRRGAKELGSKGTESGILMLKELISIFNTINKNKITMAYQDDIFEKEGTYFGTALIIQIPKHYNFDL